MRRRILLAGALAAPAIARANTIWLPRRSIRLIVPFAPSGGALDIIVRLLAWAMAPRLGVTVIVDNAPGPGGSLGANNTAWAQADGHTALLLSPGPLLANPFLFPGGEDEAVNFVPVALTTSSPMVILAAPHRPERDLPQLVATLRRGTRLSYASAGPGSGGHMVMETLKARLDLPTLQHVPFRGAGPSLEALTAHQVPLAVAPLASANRFVEGRLAYPLAVTTAARWPDRADVPTVRESVLPGFDYASWTCLIYPPGVSEEARPVMNWAVNQALRDPTLRTRLRDMGVETVGGTPTGLARYLQDERAKWAEAARIAEADLL